MAGLEPVTLLPRPSWHTVMSSCPDKPRFQAVRTGAGDSGHRCPFKGKESRLGPSGPLSAEVSVGGLHWAEECLCSRLSESSLFRGCWSLGPAPARCTPAPGPRVACFPSLQRLNCKQAAYTGTSLSHPDHDQTTGRPPFSPSAWKVLAVNHREPAAVQA